MANDKNYTRPDKTGVLFTNTDKEGNQPDRTGRIKVEGKEWRIAAWESTSSNGMDYLSLKISEFQDKRYEELKNDRGDDSAKDEVVLDDDVDIEQVEFDQIPF